MKTPMFQATDVLECSYAHNTKGHSMTRPHYHDGYEIYLMTEGMREIFFQHDKYLLKPRSLCIISPHIFHAAQKTKDEKPYSRHLINFSSKIFNSFLRQQEIESVMNEISSCIMGLNENQMEIILTHIKNLNEYIDMSKRGITRGRKLAYMEVYRLMDRIVRMIDNAPEMLSLADLSKISDSEIYDVLMYIDLHYMENISPNDMMKLAHMSKSNFYRSFRYITGDSFSHYLNRLRAAKAHELLSHSGLPLHEIAKRTGFSSTAHMTRIFKEVHGVSPSEYRRT